MKDHPPKLLDQVRHTLRRRNYALRTEETYVNWIKRFIFFHHKKHPREMNTSEIEQFLTHLAVNERVAPSTQDQALAALLFLYHIVLRQPLIHPIDAVRAKQPQRLPVVLNQAETRRLIDQVPDTYQLPVQLLYGAGLRLTKCIRLRVKDVDFDQHQTCAELVEASSSATVKAIKTGTPSCPIA